MDQNTSNKKVVSTLVICLSCLARRMPDGMVFISQEELDELEHDEDYDGNIAISYVNDGIEISCL